MGPKCKRAVALSIFFVLIMTVNFCTVSFAAVPTDVIGTEYQEAVSSLTELGIISGFQDGTYKPDNPIKRAEAAKIVIGMIGCGGFAESSKGSTKFKDVAASFWATGFINAAVDISLFKGDAQGNFRPNDNISYSEIITVLIRALGMGPEVESSGKWPDNYLSKANELGIVNGVRWAKVSDGATRGNVAKLVWNTLNIEYNYRGVTLLEEIYPDYAKKIRKEMTVEEIAQNAESTVFVRGYESRKMSYGSGVLLGNDLIVTNYHVLQNSWRFGIVYDDTEEDKEYRTSTILYMDPMRDLAIVCSPGDYNNPVKLGDSDELERGQKVVAIGSPLGLKNTVSEGIVSGFQTIDGYEYIQITAPVSPGSSGGGVFNMYGELIGITTLKAVNGENISFAIPINDIKKVLSVGGIGGDVAFNNHVFRLTENMYYGDESMRFNSISLFDIKKKEYSVNYYLIEDFEGTKVFQKLYKTKEFRDFLTRQLYSLHRILDENFYTKYSVSIYVGDNSFSYKYDGGKLSVTKNNIVSSVSKTANNEFTKRFNELAELDNKPLFRIFDGGKWGYIDIDGNIVIKPEFDEAGIFSGGLAWALDNIGTDYSTYGYMDKTGEFILPPAFQSVGPFSGGLASVMIDNKYGYINENGRVIIEPMFDWAEPFFVGLARVVLNGKPGYINMLGRFVIEPGKYDSVGIISEGLIGVKEGPGSSGKWGYVDWAGESVIDPVYDYADFFAEGLAAVSKGGKYGYIDHDGKTVIQHRFDMAGHFFEGLAAVRFGNEENGKWGYIDKTGKVVIDAVFDDAYGFTDGLALVRVGGKEAGKWGFIDTKGNYVIEPAFDAAEGFYNGLAMVRIGDEETGYWCYINKAGEFVWKPSQLSQETE